MTHSFSMKCMLPTTFRMFYMCMLRGSPHTVRLLIGGGGPGTSYTSSYMAPSTGGTHTVTPTSFRRGGGAGLDDANTMLSYSKQNDFLFFYLSQKPFVLPHRTCCLMDPLIKAVQKISICDSLSENFLIRLILLPNTSIILSYFTNNS